MYAYCYWQIAISNPLIAVGKPWWNINLWVIVLLNHWFRSCLRHHKRLTHFCPNDDIFSCIFSGKFRILTKISTNCVNEALIHDKTAFGSGNGLYHHEFLWKKAFVPNIYECLLNVSSVVNVCAFIPIETDKHFQVPICHHWGHFGTSSGCHLQQFSSNVYDKK